MSHGPFPQENLHEPFEYDKWQSVEKFDRSDDDNEISKNNCQFSPERIELCDGSADPDENSEFEVDFDAAFGPTAKEFDDKDPWYLVPSMTIGNLGRSSRDQLLVLENDEEFDAEFNAALGLDVKSYVKSDSYDDTSNFISKNPPQKGNEKKLVDVEYDFEEDHHSDEEKQMKIEQEKKYYIRDIPAKNLSLEKLILYSDVDNQMYARGIKDPLVSTYLSVLKLSRYFESKSCLLKYNIFRYFKLIAKLVNCAILVKCEKKLKEK